MVKCQEFTLEALRSARDKARDLIITREIDYVKREIMKAAEGGHSIYVWAHNNQLPEGVVPEVCKHFRQIVSRIDITDCTRVKFRW